MQKEYVLVKNVKDVSRSRSKRRRAVIILWIATMLMLFSILLLILWSHFYAPEFFEFFFVTGSIAIPVAFVLLIVMLALNRWKPLKEDPDKQKL